MDYRYHRTQENGDATSNYYLEGTFPVRFIDFFYWILEHEDSFRVEFVATNYNYGGWLGNTLEVSKNSNDEWYWARQEPEGWFNEIAGTNITQCKASGGWGQMTYFCTFEE